MFVVNNWRLNCTYPYQMGWIRMYFTSLDYDDHPKSETLNKRQTNENNINHNWSGNFNFYNQSVHARGTKTKSKLRHDQTFK